MKLQKISILIVVIIAVAAMLYFPQSSSDQPQPNETYSDSIDAADRPMFTARKDTQDTIPTPPPVGEDFAPGTVLIRATIISVEFADEGPSNIVVKVGEVMGYGPSTPPIATGTEFTFNITNFLKNRSVDREQLRKKSEIKMLIASQQGLRTADSDKGQSWTLIELKK